MGSGFTRSQFQAHVLDADSRLSGMYYPAKVSHSGESGRVRSLLIVEMPLVVHVEFTELIAPSLIEIWGLSLL